MIDYNQAGSGINVTKLAKKVSTPAPVTQPTKIKQSVSNMTDSMTSTDRGKWGSGSKVAKVFDVLSTPQYAVAGASRALAKGENIFKGAKSGVENRASFSDVAGDLGVKNKYLKAGLGLAGDLLLDPLNFIPPAKIAKLAGKTKVAKNLITTGSNITKSDVLKPTMEVLQNVGGLVSNKIRTGGNVDYLRDIGKYRQKVGEASEIGEELAKAVTVAPMDFTYGKYVIKQGDKIPEVVQRRLTNILEGGISSASPELTKVAEPLRQKFMEIANKQVKEGLASPETFQKYMGKYLPKYYKAFEGAEGSIPSGGIKVSTGQFKKRKDTPFAIDFGEIKDLGYRGGKGVSMGMKNVATGEFFSDVASKYAKSADEIMAMGEEGSKYIQLPEKNMGNLNGKFVPKYIYDDIKGAGVLAGDKPSKFTKAFDKGLSAWKAGKTVLSPSQQVRNQIGNQVLNYLVGGAGVFKKYPQAIKELKSKGKFFQEAKASGLFTSNFNLDELEKLVPELDKIKSAIGTKKVLLTAGKKYDDLTKFAGKFQQNAEQIGKLQQFIFQRSKGKSIQEAKDLATKALFDYGDITPFERKIKRAVPFYTFSRKSIPLVAETSFKSPTRLTAFKKGETAVNELTPERENERKILPEYLQDAVRIPGTKKGYYSPKFIYPWGNMFDESSLPFGVNIPAYDIASKVISGYDPYFKQQLTNSPLKKDMTKAKIGSVVRTLMPALPGNLLGDLAPGTFKPDYAGRKKSLTQIGLSNFLGQKTYDLNEASAVGIQSYNIGRLESDTQAEIKKAYSIKDPEKRKARIKELVDNLQERSKEIYNRK